MGIMAPPPLLGFYRGFPSVFLNQDHTDRLRAKGGFLAK